ncbi:MAG TPA: hypothetical protein VFN65_04870 [Solirubrobacteraceae bacterium]|nr:hypothetical protein [Solirubrobacteraceae bacterium]
MPGPGLWVRFLEDGDGAPAPRLRTGAAPDAPEIALSDRARWVLAAIALPRELAPETASDERQRARLGSRVWSSGEITARIPYQHRSTIRHGLADLRRAVNERTLVLEDHLLIDTGRGRYGVRPGRMTVDLVELHALRGNPDAVDRYLDGALGGRGHARLAPICATLLDPVALTELEAAVQASVARAATRPAPPTRPEAAEPPGAVPGAASGAAPYRAPTAGTGSAAATRSDAAPGGGAAPRSSRRHLALVTLGLAVLVAAAIAVALALGRGSRSAAAIRAAGPPRVEVAGGVAHTWSDPLTAGGRPGHEILDLQKVRIACRLHGFTVQDGNTWWYLIDSPPWSRHFFVTADAFYNNGHTSGTLRGSAFVDPRVARCTGVRSLR